LAALALVGAALAIGGEALAVIGRPLSPLSFAGVARRTTRRSMYGYGAGIAPGAYGAGVYGYGIAGVAGALTALPAGCYAGVACGGVVYRPVYQGSTVTYVPQ
jgi:hypothetical protein